MIKHHSDKSRKKDPHARSGYFGRYILRKFHNMYLPLPDVEVFYARPVVIECDNCGDSILNGYVPWNGSHNPNLTCPECMNRATQRFPKYSPGGYWYWFCYPGCLPDSDPVGPFRTEELAIENAQEANGPPVGPCQTNDCTGCSKIKRLEREVETLNRILQRSKK